MTKSAEEIEREVERTRSHMDRTVDELSERMSPGQLLDEVVRGMRGSGRLSGMGRQVREQPLPLALFGVGLVWVGAGLVWLAVSSEKKRREEVPYGGYRDYTGTLRQPGEDRYSDAMPAPDGSGLP